MTLPRLMDMGLERLSNAISDMGNLAQDSVMRAIQAYAKGEQITQQALDRAVNYRPCPTRLKNSQSNYLPVTNPLPQTYVT